MYVEEQNKQQSNLNKHIKIQRKSETKTYVIGDFVSWSNRVLQVEVN